MISFFSQGKAGADLGVGRGGRGPPFCPGIFFVCKQCLSDGTSCFVSLDVFSAAPNDLPCHKCNITVERSNSSLHFVKSGFRSAMREDRLNALLLVFIHKDIALDYDAIIDDYMYAKRNQRRMTFINLLH